MSYKLPPKDEWQMEKDDDMIQASAYRDQVFEASIDPSISELKKRIDELKGKKQLTYRGFLLETTSIKSLEEMINKTKRGITIAKLQGRSIDILKDILEAQQGVFKEKRIKLILEDKKNEDE